MHACMYVYNFYMYVCMCVCMHVCMYACMYRFILVPAAVAEALFNPLRLGLMQYVAKNVGLRRARGRWVIVTQADA